MRATRSQKIVAGFLALTLTAGLVPTPAIAEDSDTIRAELEVAQQTLSGIYEQAEVVAEGLNGTRVRLDETNAAIEQLNVDIERTAGELAEAREELSLTMSWAYKVRPGIFSLIFSSESFDELVSNIYYANRIATAQTEQVDLVNELQAQQDQQMIDLEANKTAQEELLAQQEEQSAQLAAAAAEAEGYLATLSDELQAALVAEEEARMVAARQEAEQQAAAAQAEVERQQAVADAAAPAAGQQQEQQQSQTETTTTTTTTTTTPEETPAPAPTPTQTETTTTTTPVESTPTTSYNGDVASIVVGTAFAQVGKEYVYGAGGPDTFDCSGLVAYCYAAAGYSVPAYSGDLAAYCDKPASQAVAGDIVWRSGHVGICIGGGQTIEALYPGAGVDFGSVSTFVSAGSPAW